MPESIVDEISVLSIIPAFEKAIAEEDIASLQKIAIILEHSIDASALTAVAMQHDIASYQHLYKLIRKSERILASQKESLKSEQIRFKKKEKRSKDYTDVRKL